MTHFLIGAPIVGLAVGVVFLVWYPAPLAVLQGVHKIVVILMAVDLAAGPLLTTVVFDRAKKSLRADLAVIASLQVAALIYGMHALFVARPCIVAFNIDRFDVVTAVDVDRTSLDTALAHGKPGLPVLRPRVVFARQPEPGDERTALMFSAMLGGPDLPHMPQWYEPYPGDRDAVIARTRPLAELRSLNKLDDSSWSAFLASLEIPQQYLGYLPLRAKVQDGAVIIDTRTAEIIRISLLQPNWG